MNNWVAFVNKVKSNLLYTRKATLIYFGKHFTV